MYQKLSHKVPQTGTLKMGGEGGVIGLQFLAKLGMKLKVGMKIKVGMKTGHQTGCLI